jgi:endonuclease III-like uncharacterized protein
LERHDAVAAEAKYDEIRILVEGALQREMPLPAVERAARSSQRPEAHPPSAMSTASRVPLAQVYNEMHGLLVQLGKHYCHKQQPKCEVCPLGAMLSQPVRSRLLLNAQISPPVINRRTSKKPAKSRV